MNAVIQANNKKQAAVVLAVAAKTEAEGMKNAAIEKATGEKRAMELRAEGEAVAIKTVAAAEAERIQKVYDSAKEHFVEGAVTYRQLQVTENALSQNTKYVLTQDGLSPTIILPQETSGRPAPQIIPVEKAKRSKAVDPLDLMSAL